MNRIGLIKLLLIILLLLILAGTNTLLFIYLHYSRDLPKIQSIRDYKPIIATDIYDRNGEIIYRLYNQKRRLFDIEKLPDYVINAFLAAEDNEFFKHKGVELTNILRALYANIKAGSIKQGGSTITQQVVKTFFLSPERTLSRKIKEAILSYRLEKNLTKKEILQLYLNQIYFGAGNYGIYEASQYFFGKSPELLNIHESAFLAALVKSPEPFATFKNPGRVRLRQNYIIQQMDKNKFITPKQAQHYLKEPLNFKCFGKEQEMTYSISYALKKIKEYIDIDRLYNNGLKIHLTIDKEIDRLIQNELTEYLDELNANNIIAISSVDDNTFDEIERELRNKISNMRNHYKEISDTFNSENFYKNKMIGIRITKPFTDGLNIKGYIDKHTRLSIIEEGNIYLGIVVKIDKSTLTIFTGESVIEITNPVQSKAKNLKRGDILFYKFGEDKTLKIANPPIIQGAVVMIDNQTGQIIGMSGGYSYMLHEFNRAVQAKRQPGSAFKPILYSYAIESSRYNIVSIENDAPVEYTDPQTGKIYRPLNYDRDEFEGEMTLIDAITHSKNTISVKLLMNLGIEDVTGFINRLGLDTEVSPYPSLALGSFEITLLSLSEFYSALAAEGRIRNSQILLSLKDEGDNELLQNNTSYRQILLPETAFIITRMLKDVVKRGTARAAFNEGLNIAGKTGTTNNYTNAWFIGYTPEITLGILIARDDNKSMGRKATGGNYAAPLFKRIITRLHCRGILKGEDFKAPASVKFINVNIHTGKRCEEESEDCAFLPFREGTEPPENNTESEMDIMRMEQ